MVPVPMVPVPIPISMVSYPYPDPYPWLCRMSYPYPYPYPWSCTRTRTHTHGLVPVPIPMASYPYPYPWSVPTLQVWALPNQEAKTVAQALTDHFLTVFGLPWIMHTDQGRNFESSLFEEVCELFGIDKTRTTPYRPQSDGFIERYNRTLLSMLSSYTNKEQDDWDTHLQLVMAAYHSADHSSTGYSPNEMMMGRNVRLPIDLVFGRPPDTPTSSGDYVQKLQTHLEEIHEIARGTLTISSEKQKRQYDHKTKEPRFQEGESVWYYCRVKRKGKSPKLQNHWHGPYRVIEKVSDILFRIQLRGTRKTLVVHSDKLKKCYQNGHEETNTEGVKGGKEVSNETKDSPLKTRLGRKIKKPQGYGIPN